MKSATDTRSGEPSTSTPTGLPEFPTNDLTAGVDWARDDHAVSIINDRGREVYRCSVLHTAAGRLGDWLAEQGYSGKIDPAVLHQRILDAARGVTGEHATSQAHITASYVALLRTLLEQIKALSTQIDRHLDAHTDAHIFTSSPRSGRVRAARLLAEIGDCRARFPTPESLTCPAGAAPSTRQSGKIRTVGFRWSCDQQLRDAVVDFDAGSRFANPWAASL